MFMGASRRPNRGSRLPGAGGALMQAPLRTGGIWLESWTSAWGVDLDLPHGAWEKALGGFEQERPKSCVPAGGVDG